MYHTHTRESITVTFKKQGRYDEAGLKQLNWFLRDWRSDEPTRMEPRLFDVVWEAYRDAGGREPIHIISAYRSPGTNAMLRSRTRGVAKFSQHTLGRAMDIAIPGVPTSTLREAGIRLQRGGVGFYPTSGSPFVHLDVGNVRAWPRMSRAQLARVFPDGKTVHLPAEGGQMPGYKLALADLQKRGGGINRPYNASVAQAPDEGASSTATSGRKRNFLTRLLGMDDDEDSGESAAPAPAPVQARTPVRPSAPVPAPDMPATVVAVAPARPAQIPLPVAAPLPKAASPVLAQVAAADAPVPPRRPSAVAPSVTATPEAVGEFITAAAEDVPPPPRKPDIASLTADLPPPPLPADLVAAGATRPAMVWMRGPQGIETTTVPSARIAVQQTPPPVVIMAAAPAPLPRPKPGMVVASAPAREPVAVVASLGATAPVALAASTQPAQPQAAAQPARTSNPIMAIANRIAGAYASASPPRTATPAGRATSASSTSDGASGSSLGLAGRIAFAAAKPQADPESTGSTERLLATGRPKLPENFAEQARELVNQRIALAYASPIGALAEDRHTGATARPAAARPAAAPARAPQRATGLVTVPLDRRGWQAAVRPQATRTDATVQPVSAPLMTSETDLLVAPARAMPYGFGSDPAYGTRTDRFAGSPVMFIRTVDLTGKPKKID